MLARIDEAVALADRQYQAFADTLMGMRDVAVGSNAPQVTIDRARTAANTFATSVVEAIAPYFSEIAGPDIPVEEIRNATNAAVRLVMERDVAATANGIRQDAMRFDMLRRQIGVIAAGLRIMGSLPSQNSFVQLDALGRRPRSAIYLRVAIRQGLVGCYTLGYSMRMIGEGRETFSAEHPEYGSAVGPAAEFDAWAAENMHPNTRWSLL